MTTLYQDDHFTFRFADDRIIPRFHLEGVQPGRPVKVFKVDPQTGARLEVLTTALVGDGGWVDLTEAIRMKAGEAFIAVPLVDSSIRSVTAGDHEAIRIVNRLAFGQDAEAQLVDALRAGGHVRVSLVAEIAGQVVGHVLFSDLSIMTNAGTIPALSLAPMAVLPGCQNQGIGSVLVRRGLEICRNGGHRIVIVLGHAHFYPRFGFSAKLAEPLDSPYSGGESWMAAELAPSALEGVSGKVIYTPPFGDL